MCKLVEHQQVDIVYEKSSGELSNRTIIPMQVPKDYAKAIDITGLSEEEVIKLQEALSDYDEYREQFMITMYSFDDWYEMTRQDQPPEIKWRSFKMTGIRYPNELD